MKSTPRNILSTKKLSIGYPGKTIASDISLEVFSGELTAVIGINGSGKSTLLKTLTGNLHPLSGEIVLGGKPLNHYSSKSLAEHISIVLSKPEFSQNLNVGEVVALGRHPYTNWLGLMTENDREVVAKSLQLTGLENHAERLCSELSDGQLQKVFIARALAQDTEIIILDEPTNHLDLYHKAFVFQLLKRLTREENKAIVFATHELNLALQLCDKIILVKDKKVIQKTPEELVQGSDLAGLFPEDLIHFDPASKSFRLKD